MEEDLVASPDMLWYFAQLEPLLHKDRSLLCISAWNDLAMGPYVADPAKLLRTDVFPGVAWLLPAQLFRNRLLQRWPKNNWDGYFRSRAGRSDRDCIIPEMPRVKHVGVLSGDINAKTKLVAQRDAS
eukprot:4200099-Amphidinium_carterae.1